MTLTIEQVNEIVSKYAEKRRAFDLAKKSKPYNHITKQSEGITQYPEYWTGYNYCAHMYDSIVVHANANTFPAHLFAVRAPNETKEQSEYIRANYKPSTLSVFEDFKSTVGRAFGDQNWSVSYNKERSERFGDDTFERYVNQELPVFGSLEMWAKGMLPTLKLIDANGIIAVYPSSIPTVVTEDGQEVVGNDLVKPEPFYYSCKQIVAKGEGYHMVVSQYKSVIKEGSKNVYDGEVLLLFDDMNVWRIEQTGKKSEFTFGQPFVYYAHNIGYVPYITLMGTPQLIDNRLIFTSPFLTAVPLLDQVVLDNSYLNMVKAMSAFPFMVALGEHCEFENDHGKCMDGQIWNGNENVNCPACGGAGVRSRFSPTGVLLIKPKTTTSEGDTGINGDYIKFVSPPLDTQEFLRREIDSNILKSRSVIHLSTSDQAVSGNEAVTATVSLNKLRSLVAFLKPISDQMFTVYEFVANVVGDMRYGQDFGGVKFVYPTTFDITTPGDYIAMISEAMKAGVPPSVIYALVYNYIKTINYTDEETTMVYDLILAADRLILMTPQEIALRVANGTVEKWQDVLHSSAPQLIAELMRDFEATEQYDSFLMLPLNEQITALEELARAKVPATANPRQQVINELRNGIN